MNAKFKMCQHVIFIKRRKFDTTNIKCFTVPVSLLLVKDWIKKITVLKSPVETITRTALTSTLNANF